MYTKFFGLNEKPFSITPDPRYLYLSERHAEALAHLLYGINEAGGFVQLTGEVGLLRAGRDGHMAAAAVHDRLLSPHVADPARGAPGRRRGWRR